MTLPETNILLMVQKSGDHQLSLVVFSHYLPGFYTSQLVIAGILPSTVAPENGWLENEFHFGAKKPIFRGELAVTFKEGRTSPILIRGCLKGTKHL